MLSGKTQRAGHDGSSMKGTTGNCFEDSQGATVMYSSKNMEGRRLQ